VVVVAVQRRWPVVMSCLVVDKDFWHGELRNVGHTASVLAVHVVAEPTSPVHGIKEAHYDVATYGFIYSLKSSSSAEKFVKSKDMLVVSPVFK
jgi:hypothetical protein